MSLAYVALGANLADPTTQVRAAIAALATLPRPVHVHCILNWRVSAFFCRYHRAVLGMPAEEALALMAVQWDPATTAHPAGPVWARFIAGGAPG